MPLAIFQVKMLQMQEKIADEMFSSCRVVGRNIVNRIRRCSAGIVDDYELSYVLPTRQVEEHIFVR